MAEKRYFVVLVDGDASVSQRDAFTAYVRSRFGFWHHISHGWLISTSSPDISAAILRDKVKELMPNIVQLVIQVSPVTWSGFFAPTAGDWIRKNWVS